MKQRTTNNNKNENMKMRKKLITALVLGACLGTQAFAQNIKEDKLTFTLTAQGQASVSTSPSVANAGLFSQGPLYYKTVTKKMTQTDILKAIAYVLHNHNPSFYTSQAYLVLVQGELGGFWNISDGLAQSYEDFSSSGPTNKLTGGFNTYGTDGTFQDDTSSSYAAYYEMNDGFPDADSANDPWCYINALETFLDNNPRTSISDNLNENALLDSGRHFLPVPNSENVSSDTETPIATTGNNPVGHMQPWGQIYVKDPGHKDSSADHLPLCENVTFFFYLAVQECYDCFYLSSFISDATFKNVQNGQSGPPCCHAPGFLAGRGVDKYYLSLSFDNTINNSYLNDVLVTNSNSDIAYYYEYVGFRGLQAKSGGADGLSPDLLIYSDPISSRLALFQSFQYETRFTLNGIVTYNWTLTLVNPTDAAYDFVGTANFAANGFGFIGLTCQLLTGTATFSEKVVKDIGCCDDVYWYDNEYNSAYWNNQGNYGTTVTGWYGPGANGYNMGYFDPYYDQYNPYPYYNIVGGEAYSGQPVTVPYYSTDMPDQNESPYNPEAALTRHFVIYPGSESSFYIY
jgi:hypothetical protein